jgi:hypothetical protein
VPTDFGQPHAAGAVIERIEVLRRGKEIAVQLGVSASTFSRVSRRLVLSLSALEPARLSPTEF